MLFVTVQSSIKKVVVFLIVIKHKYRGCLESSKVLKQCLERWQDRKKTKKPAFKDYMPILYRVSIMCPPPPNKFEIN